MSAIFRTPGIRGGSRPQILREYPKIRRLFITPLFLNIIVQRPPSRAPAIGLYLRDLDIRVDIYPSRCRADAERRC
jgi:hypothetical protein